VIRSHGKQIVVADLFFQRAENSRQVAIHLAEGDAQLLRIRSVLVAHEVRTLVIEQDQICNAVFADGLVLDHGDHRVGFERGKERRVAHGGRRVDLVMHPLGISCP